MGADRPVREEQPLADLAIRQALCRKLHTYLHPAAEWEQTGIFLEPGTRRGQEEIVAYMRTIRDEFDDFAIEFEQVRQADDERLVIDLKMVGTGEQSQVPVEVAFTMVVGFKDGLVHRVRNFQRRDRDQALEAAGLRE